MAKAGIPFRLFGMLLFAALLIGAERVEAMDLNISGYFRTLAMLAQAPDVAESFVSANRLRLQLKGNLAPGVATDLQYDNDYMFGSHLDTSPLLAGKDIPSSQYWNAQSTYVNTPQEFGAHRLYRASVTWSIQDIDIRLGRQRVAWGTGRFWSPLDLINPINPTALDREERLGVDALLLDAKMGPLSRISAVHAPQQDARLNSSALQWHDNVRGVDYSLVAGRFWAEDVLGFDLATQLGQAGLRGEVTTQRTATGSSYSRALAGIDYAFPNTLTFSVETYYNGNGSSDAVQYRWGDYTTGRVVSLATRYWGAFMSYELTPLLKSLNYFVLNADDNSRGVDLRLLWSVRPDTDLVFGGRNFWGAAGTEFRGRGNAVYIQAQVYF